MTSTMTTDAATALRRPFPAESVGKLPKSTCRACSQSQRKRCEQHSWVSNCPECRGSHSSATLHLDYVGHAAVTDRLLTVDPEWSWEFSENDPTTGHPSLRHSLDPEGNLWIRLTICGVTRIGVGDGKSAKEKIGDAIRNAGMRFGMGLDLWAKENLVEFQTAAQSSPASPPAPPAGSADEGDDHGPAGAGEPGLPADVSERMFAAWHAAGGPGERISVYVTSVLGREVTSGADLSVADAEQVIQALARLAHEQAGEGSGDAAPGEADPSPAVDPAADAARHPALISRPQQRMLLGLFSKFDLTGDDTRDERLRIVSQLAGRVVDSTSALTKAEANKVITTLGEVEDVAQLLAIANGGETS